MTQARRWPEKADDQRRAAIAENIYADEQLTRLISHLEQTINDPLALLYIERARRAIAQSTSYLRLARLPNGED